MANASSSDESYLEDVRLSHLSQYRRGAASVVAFDKQQESIAKQSTEALSVINGGQTQLQSAIQNERSKRYAAEKVALHQQKAAAGAETPRRRPPAPPGKVIHIKISLLLSILQ